MDYNKIANESTLKLQEDKYCETVMNMLQLLDEQEAINLINSLPSHLKEASMKKQAAKMESKIKEILYNVKKFKRNLNKTTQLDKNSSLYLGRKDKVFIEGKIANIEKLAEQTLKILQDPLFREWYMEIDKNTGLFGFKKIGAKGPSRKDLGVE